MLVQIGVSDMVITIRQNNTTTKHLEVQMKQQTSVDWLIEEINKQKAWADPSKLEPIIQQALAIEREQIEKAYDAGHDDGHDEANGDGSYYDTKEDYYERTYGKEAGHEL